MRSLLAMLEAACPVPPAVRPPDVTEKPGSSGDPLLCAFRVVDGFCLIWIGLDYGTYESHLQGLFMSDVGFFLETGARIRELRGALSQAEFAERIGVDRKTVVRWEAGERLPDGKSLLALMEVFGGSASYLLTGSEGGAKLADASEQVLIDSYRRCNADAKRNLIQTAALLSAGMASPPGGSGTGGGIHQRATGAGSVQIGSIKGRRDA